jgi:hypothetical protein
MADEVDLANEQAEKQLQAALTHRKPVVKLAPIDSCHWCEEPLDGLKLFCDGDCATRYNRYHGV